MPETGIERPRFCSQCGQPVVVADASFCKDCGAPLAGTAWFSHNITWRPVTALILSIVPGLGQFYKGHPGKALFWFFGVLLAYSINIAFGFIIHAICAFNAALSGAIREEAFARSARGPRSKGLSANAGPHA